MNTKEQKKDERPHSSPKSTDGFSRRSFMKKMGAAFLSGGMLGSTTWPSEASGSPKPPTAAPGHVPKKAHIIADPTDIPGPIHRRTSKTHDISLESQEVVAEIEDGVTFKYMTFGGQVPGPMIRVRQGDTVRLTHKSHPDNTLQHNVDFHAVYGTGGGAPSTMVAPGMSKTIEFKALYPGAFIYHCAVPNLDMHISSGMFGMIVVEPKEGLPEVDHEFYLGQHEVYTDKEVGEKGFHHFDTDAMLAENPTYVLLNGARDALTDRNQGAIQVNQDETARIFMVTGGPNLTSSFHPIGNVWTKAWREGSLTSTPEEYLQTCHVAPGSCGVFQMDYPVKEKIFLVDHAISRYAKKGMLGVINVNGEEKPEIFNTHPQQ